MNYETANINKIIQQYKELQDLSPLKPEDERRLNKKFRLEFNYNSNHLEGNTLTYGQTELLLLHDRSSGDARASDFAEMKAHDVALAQVNELARDSERPLTEQFIKELNKIILVESFWKDALTPDGQTTRKKIEIGVYKTHANSVRLKNGEIHEYASPEETPAKMHDLMNWYNDQKNTLHPVQLAAEFHYRFVCIHPFDDGNGRVARLLMNYILYKNNFPPVVIKADDKEGYLTALQKADSGDKLAIVEYIENQMIWSLDLAIKAAKGLSIDELTDLDKEIAILKREKLTSPNIFKTPKVAFELINHINDDLWTPINNQLQKFDDFFAETSVTQYFNYGKIEKKRIVRHPLNMFEDREERVKKYKVMGFDLNETEVQAVSWSREMLSLKSASSKEDFEISLNIELENSNYITKVIETNNAGNAEKTLKNKTLLFRQERPYNSFFTKVEVDNILRLISNHMIEILKSKS